MQFGGDGDTVFHSFLGRILGQFIDGFVQS